MCNYRVIQIIVLPELSRTSSYHVYIGVSYVGGVVILIELRDYKVLLNIVMYSTQHIYISMHLLGIGNGTPSVASGLM